MFRSHLGSKYREGGKASKHDMQPNFQHSMLLMSVCEHTWAVAVFSSHAVGGGGRQTAEAGHSTGDFSAYVTEPLKV